MAEATATVTTPTTPPAAAAAVTTPAPAAATTTPAAGATTSSTAAPTPATEEGTLLGGKDPAAPAAATDPAKPGATTEKPASTGAPEKYVDFKLPEGMTADKATMDAFTPVAKELNLTQDQAQKLVDLQANAIANQQNANLAHFNKIRDDWKNETIQALGPNHKEELAAAARFVDRFGTPELRKLLNDTGLGNNKDFVQAFIKAGKAISEDKFVEGKRDGGGPAQKSAAQIIYPNMK